MYQNKNNLGVLFFFIIFMRFTQNIKAMRAILIFQIYLICVIISTTKAEGQSATSKNDFPAFDTLFKTASNSPEYVVAKKNQINALREYFEKERTERLKTIELQEKEISLLQNSMDSVLRNANTQVSEPISSNSEDYPIILLIVTAGLLALVIALFLRVINAGKLYREGKDSYNNLVMEFDLHKKNAIERERKLMRKLIDLQNQLDLKSNPKG
jgi:hypothetical protein